MPAGQGDEGHPACWPMVAVLPGFASKSAKIRVILTRSGVPCRVKRRGAVAQLGECLTGSQEVTSSILVSSTIFNNLPVYQAIKGNKKVTGIFGLCRYVLHQQGSPQGFL